VTEKISIAPHVVGCLLDIALVVDCSGSIRESNPEGVDNWQYVLNFVVNTVTSLNIEKTATHVGVVTFGRPYAVKTLLSLSLQPLHALHVMSTLSNCI